MELLRGALGLAEDPALDIAVAHALVRRAGRGESGPVIRVYRPAAPVVAFSRRDSLRSGFDAAVRVARAAGFMPLIRPQGGRAVAYTEQSIVVDHVSPHPDHLSGMDERFATYGEMWAGVLREHGIDAQVGAVPGEYCPGAYSVNARGRVKLVGTAQRLIRRAWLFSAVAVVDGADTLRPLLTEVYRCLGLDFDAASVGSVRTEVPDAALDPIEAAVVAAYHARFGLVPAPLDDQLVDAAQALLNEHRL